MSLSGQPSSQSLSSLALSMHMSPIAERKALDTTSLISNKTALGVAIARCFSHDRGRVVPDQPASWLGRIRKPPRRRAGESPGPPRRKRASDSVPLVFEKRICLCCVGNAFKGNRAGFSRCPESRRQRSNSYQRPISRPFYFSVSVNDALSTVYESPLRELAMNLPCLSAGSCPR